MPPGTSQGSKCLPQLKIGKERSLCLEIMTRISLVPPLLLGPVGPKLDSALRVSEIFTKYPCLPHTPRTSHFIGTGCDLDLRIFKTSPCISNVQPPPLPANAPALDMRPRMLPVFFGEGIAVNPEPAHEIRCNSEVKYASEKHFRDNVFYAPVPTVTAYSETIVAAPNCTWRNYRSQLTLEPRPRALHFRSTTIIFPKRARSTFRTTLQCSLGRPSRWFTSSVQLQLCQPTVL
ncbi:refilin A [Rhinolophus ferrumequinum]|uniref:Refilin A n=1 Tax=Rhinolophus ferrumequinum TaxID=59479 RepID=A0A7J7RR38_RHIFE|nr:refilin-A isoform X3 [Rhinolophus ferrumequinum]KAF6278374.1 refilin A [Rhinolophus ferrumequinum]